MTDDTTKTDRIRRLNDLARNVPAMANATWMMTRGVNALLTGDDPAELMVLLRPGNRLSVMPVTATHWKFITSLL